MYVCLKKITWSNFNMFAQKNTWSNFNERPLFIKYSTVVHDTLLCAWRSKFCGHGEASLVDRITRQR